MGRTILIVEDNEDTRAVYAAMLEFAGYGVLEAENGEEGVRVAQEHAPDLVLMDIAMPVLDGWGAIERLRADAGTAAIPVVVLSAHVPRPQERERALQLGVREYLTKPLPPSQVLAKVKAYLAAEPCARAE